MPKGYALDGSKRAIIFSHAFGEIETGVLSGAPSLYADLLYSMANAGFPMVSARNGGDQWGNDIHLAHMDNTRTYLHDNLLAKTDKVMLVGTSMGGLASLCWARA